MAHTDLPAFLTRPAEGFYTSEVPAPQERRGAWPLRTFLPTGYEPNYPYPLLVFLHGRGGSEEQILRLAPQLSRRNYICIGLRGPRSLGLRDNGFPAYSWDGEEEDGTNNIEEYVFRAVEQTRRHYHVHSERIYLAGYHEGATLAYQLGLMYPQRFAGIISLNGTMARGGRPLLRLPEVRHLRVLIGHGVHNTVVPLELARQDFRLLYTAGLSIRMHTYAVNHGIHLDMLRDINRWIMHAINTEEV